MPMDNIEEQLELVDSMLLIPAPPSPTEPVSDWEESRDTVPATLSLAGVGLQLAEMPCKYWGPCTVHWPMNIGQVAWCDF
jgi:hypothetical protein